VVPEPVVPEAVVPLPVVPVPVEPFPLVPEPVVPELVVPLPVVPGPVVPVEMLVPVVVVPEPVVPPAVVPEPVVPEVPLPVFPLPVVVLVPDPEDAWLLLTGAVTTPPQPLARASTAAMAGNKTVILIDDFIRFPSNFLGAIAGASGRGGCGRELWMSIPAQHHTWTSSRFLRALT
jgi:hypothetical protein